MKLITLFNQILVFLPVCNETTKWIACLLISVNYVHSAKCKGAILGHHSRQVLLRHLKIDLMWEMFDVS